MAKYNTGRLDSLFALDSLTAPQPVDSMRMEWDKLTADQQAEYRGYAEFQNVLTHTAGSDTSVVDSGSTASSALKSLKNISANAPTVVDSSSVTAVDSTSNLANIDSIRTGADDVADTNKVFSKAFEGFGLPTVSERLQTNLMPAVGIGAFEVGKKIYTTIKSRLGEGGFWQKTSKANTGLFKNLLAYDLAMHSQGLIYNYLRGEEQEVFGKEVPGFQGIEYGGKNIKFGEESYTPAIASGAGAWGIYHGTKAILGKAPEIASNFSKLIMNNAKVGRGAYLFDKAMTSATDDAILHMTGRGPVPNYLKKQQVGRARSKAEKKIFKQLRKELGAKKFNTLKKVLKNVGDNKLGRGEAIGKYIIKKSPWLGGKIIALASLGAAGKLTPSWITQGVAAGMNILLAKDIFDLAMTDKFIQNALGLEVSDIPTQEQALVDEWIREERYSIDPDDPFFAPQRRYGPHLDY